MIALGLLIALGSPGQEASQDPDDLTLRPGHVVRAAIRPSDPRASSPVLDLGSADGPFRGRRYSLTVEETGAYALRLHSHLFDAYLVLRDGEGHVVRERGSGWFSTHARLVQTLEAGRPYSVDVCALYGEIGEFELSFELFERGDDAGVDDEEQRDDVARSVELRALQYGAADPRTLRSRGELATYAGYDEAIARLGELLTTCEAQLGEAHPTTSSVQHLLATTLKGAERYDEALVAARRAVEINAGLRGRDHPWNSPSSTNLVDLLRSRSAFDEAADLARRVLDVQREFCGPSAPETSAAQSSLAAVFLSQGRYADAEQLARESLALREDAPGATDSELLLPTTILASSLMQLGRYAEAERAGLRAVELATSVSGAEDPSTGERLNSLGLTLRRQDKFAEAIESYRRALAIFEDAHGPEHPAVARALSNMGLALGAAGRHQDALSALERSLAIREQVYGPRDRVTAFTATNLAQVLSELGRYEEAESLHRRSSATFEDTLGPEHTSTLTALNNLGNLLMRQRRYRDAIEIHERVLATRERNLPENHPHLGSTLTNLASCYRYVGELEVARSMAERAVACLEASESGSGLAYATKTLGRILRDQRDYAAAEAAARQAIDEFERIQSPETAVALHDVAQAFMRQGRYAESRDLHQRILAKNEMLLGAWHRNTAVTLYELALVNAVLGDTRRALELMLRSSEVVRAWMRELARTGATEADRLHYAAGHRRRAGLLRALLNRMEPTPLDLERVYQEHLGWKGSVFRSTAWLRERVFSEPSAEEERDWMELKQLQTRISRLASQPASTEVDRDLEELMSLREELETALVRQVEEVWSGGDTSVETLGASLPSESVLVDFEVYTDWDIPEDHIPYDEAMTRVPRVAAWVLRPNEHVRRVDLAEAPALEELVHAFVDTIVAPGRLDLRGISVGGKSGRSGEVAAKLRDALWAPLRPHVGDASLVFVSPDSFLATLPFECLPDDDGKFLIESRAFVYLEDVSQLARASGGTNDRRVDDLLTMGDVDYLRRGQALADWSPLAETGPEIEQIDALHQSAFGSRARRLSLSGTRATEAALKSAMPSASVVHLATHGFFRPEGWASMEEALTEDSTSLGSSAPPSALGAFPGLLSGLVCAAAEAVIAESAQTAEDGLLTAEEVAWIDLSDCDLVVLSACQSALGHSESGEGMMGLRRAFQQAGAKSVISSLWNVRDASTRELMVDFYRRLWEDGAGVLDALRGAQLGMLERNRELYGDARPATWAAFVLSGEWR